jgi:hypothetical protein
MHPGQPQQPYGQPPQPVGGAGNTQLGAILMIVAGVCIVVGLVSKSFVTASWDEGSESIKIGFMGVEVCDRDECESVPWDKMGKGDGDIKAVRMIGLISGFLGAGLCAMAALMAFSNKRPPVGAIQGVLGVAAFSLAYFLFRFISEGKGEMAPGPGFAAFIGLGGVIMGSIVSKTMFKHLAPGMPGAPMAYGGQPMAHGHPMMAPPPPPPAATTPCTRCRQPAQFVAQYQRWYCPSCQQYL